MNSSRQPLIHRKLLLGLVLLGALVVLCGLAALYGEVQGHLIKHGLLPVALAIAVGLIVISNLWVRRIREKNTPH
jgi:hypothetical protein